MRILTCTLAILLVLSTALFSLQVAVALEQNFGPLENLSQSEERYSAFPQTASSGPHVYVAWEESLEDSKEIMLRASHDGGATFDSEVKLSNLNDSNLAIGGARIAASGQDVYVVWHQGLNGGSDILFVASHDGGETFSSPLNLSNDRASSSDPQIAISDNSKIHVVWQSAPAFNAIAGIFYRSSTDGGDTFAEAKRISGSGTNFEWTRISASDDNIHIVWDTIFDVFVTSSTNNGDTFSTPKSLSPHPSLSFLPSVASSGDRVFVAWMDREPGEDEIFMAKSTDAGSTFSVGNFSNNEGMSESPIVLAEGANVVLAWRDDTFSLGGDGNIIVASSKDSGESFGDPVDLGPATTGFFDLALSGDSIHAAWMSQGGWDDIFYSASDDVGSTYSPALLLSNTTFVGLSFFPSIELTSDGGTIVFWQEDAGTGGIPEIVFKSTVVSSDERLFCGKEMEDYVSVVRGTDGNDELQGTSGEDLILGFSGDDNIAGLAGDDCIVAGSGADTVFGGRGNDLILGGEGNDILKGGTGDDRLLGDTGNDRLSGGKGNDYLDGEDGKDRLNGGEDPDRCIGDDIEVGCEK